MIATVVNTIAIILGSILGISAKKLIKAKYNKVVMEALALAVIAIGISQAMSGLLDEKAHSVLFIIALVVGKLIGELLDLEDKLERLGRILQSKFSESDDKFVEGFISATLLFCVGTMTILGSIKSGVENNHTILYAKSIIDGITAFFLASAYGVGVALSAISVLLIQGSLTLFAVYFENYVSTDLLREISIVGGIMLIAMALRVLKIKAIKVANYIPALFVVVI